MILQKSKSLIIFKLSIIGNQLRDFKDTDLKLQDVKKFAKEQNEFAYDHIMILAPSINNFKSPDMTIETLLKFFDNGGNIYIALDSTSKEMGRTLVKEFGAELFPAKSSGN